MVLFYILTIRTQSVLDLYIALDLAVHKMDDALGMLGRGGLVGDENNRLTFFFIEMLKDGHDILAGF